MSESSGSVNAGGRLMVVDDEEIMLRLFGRVLSGEHRLGLFRSAEEFLEKAEPGDCDIVFADVNLPGMGGLELVRRLKAIAPHCDAVVITGDPTLDNAIEALKAGAYDFLVKPFHADQLLAVTRRCLEKRRLSAELAAVKRAREELSAAYSQLKGAERMKEAFLAVVGHELRTPLTKILGGLSLLEADKGRPPEEKVLAAVRNGAEGLHGAIEELIAYADASKEPPPGACAPVDLNEVVRQVCAGLAAQAAQAGVELSVRCAPGPAALSGAEDNIRTAVRNLVLNAITFNSPGGHAAAEVSGPAPGRGPALRVVDDGIGIPEKLLSGLGNPFYQAADYLTRKTGGLGLGLAIAKRVAEAHGGSLTVAAAPGRGTAFTMTFGASDPCARGY